jgi:hypothetical protein
MPAGTCLALLDNWTGTSYTLTDSTAVTLELEPQTHYADRFVLSAHAEPEVTAMSTWCGGGQVDLGWEDDEVQGWSVSWVGPEAGTASGEPAIEGLASGSYEVAWSLGSGACAGTQVVEVPEPCQGDFTGDGHRGAPDLLGLLASIQPSPPPAALTFYDCDCDGALAIGDVLEFLGVFGLSCNPEE